MEILLKGKIMWGYVDGTFAKPLDEQNAKSTKELETWEVNNSKIGMQLAKYGLTKDVQNYLKMVYVLYNFAKQY